MSGAGSLNCAAKNVVKKTTKKLPSLKPGCQNTSQEYGCVACGVRASDVGLPTANGLLTSIE